MTLSTTTTRTSASGNGSTTSFAFSFKIWAASNLKVYLRDTTTLVDTLQTLTTDYTVDIVSYPNTGNVVFTTAPASGKTVVIVRQMPLTQELDLEASGNFAAENVEVQLDKLAAEIQTLREMIARSPQLPIGSSLTDLSLESPTSSHDGYAVTWDDGGEGFILSAIADVTEVTVSAYAASFLDDTTAAAARVTLGLLDSIVLAASDETTALTASAGKVTFHMPYAMTLTEVFAGLTTVQASGDIFTVDVNANASSIFSTVITIDNGEATSLTADAAPVISTASLAKGDKITVDIDQIGNGSATGLKVYLTGYRA